MGSNRPRFGLLLSCRNTIALLHALVKARYIAKFRTKFMMRNHLSKRMSVADFSDAFACVAEAPAELRDTNRPT